MLEKLRRMRTTQSSLKLFVVLCLSPKMSSLAKRVRCLRRCRGDPLPVVKGRHAHIYTNILAN